MKARQHLNKFLILSILLFSNNFLTVCFGQSSPRNADSSNDSISEITITIEDVSNNAIDTGHVIFEENKYQWERGYFSIPEKIEANSNAELKFISDGYEPYNIKFKDINDNRITLKKLPFIQRNHQLVTTIIILLILGIQLYVFNSSRTKIKLLKNSLGKKGDYTTKEVSITEEDALKKDISELLNSYKDNGGNNDIDTEINQDNDQGLISTLFKYLKTANAHINKLINNVLFKNNDKDTHVYNTKKDSIKSDISNEEKERRERELNRRNANQENKINYYFKSSIFMNDEKFFSKTKSDNSIYRLEFLDNNLNSAKVYVEPSQKLFNDLQSTVKFIIRPKCNERNPYELKNATNIRTINPGEVVLNDYKWELKKKVEIEYITDLLNEEKESISPERKPDDWVRIKKKDFHNKRIIAKRIMYKNLPKYDSDGWTLIE